jgi:hypothetical protein
LGADGLKARYGKSDAILMTSDEGRPFEFGNQVLTSSYRKAAAAIICMEKPCGIYAARLSRLGAGL